MEYGGHVLIAFDDHFIPKLGRRRSGLIQWIHLIVGLHVGTMTDRCLTSCIPPHCDLKSRLFLASTSGMDNTQSLERERFMAGGEGKENSSEAVSLPLEPLVAASSRPVFISYSSHDAVLAQKVCSALEAAGFPCWIAPRNVIPGTMYADGIVHAIDDSSIVVLILSERAIASAHVGREIERAVAKRHPVVALRIDAAPLTAAFEYFLNQSQWIEGGGSDAAIAQLVSAVGQHLAPGTASSPTNSHQASAVQRKTIGRQMWVIAAVVVAVVLAGGYFLVDKAWRAKQDTTASTAFISDKSIAVLPFTDMSEKKDQEYFADGMAEEIIDLLVRVPGLKVISRASSFQFKGKNQDLQKISTQLGVAYVLQGSVRKSGDRLRVTAQLINSRDGAQLWSQTYDRDLSDVLKMQDEIALALVRALQIEVGVAYGSVSRPELHNTEAYTVYLQGLHALNGTNKQSIEKALSDFQRAFDLDPSFADAAAGIGAAYLNLGQFGYMMPAVAYEKSRQATELALKLDPNLANAHAALGSIHNIYGDRTGADQELKLARALAPNDATVLFTSSIVSGSMGRSDEALKFLNASMERNPLFPGTYLILGIGQLGAGRLSEAETSLRHVLELESSHAYVHYLLGNVLLARSQPVAALVEYSKESVDAVRIGGSAMAYFAMGRKSESDAALAQMVAGMTDHPFAIAEVYSFRGETDEAFTWLDRARARKDPGLASLVHNPAFKKLEDDPRYQQFLPKIELPE
jgi:TolB-like protein/Flp pilus assembly protein TadD